MGRGVAEEAGCEIFATDGNRSVVSGSTGDAGRPPDAASGDGAVSLPTFAGFVAEALSGTAGALPGGNAGIKGAADVARVGDANTSLIAGRATPFGTCSNRVVEGGQGLEIRGGAAGTPLLV